MKVEALVKEDQILKMKTLKLYCNLYIEYYYKAIQYESIVSASISVIDA